MKKFISFVTVAVALSASATLGVGVSAAANPDLLGPQPRLTPHCWDRDACSPDNKCRRQGSVYVSIVPARLKSWRSGPTKDVICVRMYWEDPGCRGVGTRDNYTTISCGEPLPVGVDGVPQTPCCQ